MNGAHLNGIRMNGSQMNGAQTNGAQMNGAHMSGTQVNRPKLMGRMCIILCPSMHTTTLHVQGFVRCLEQVFRDDRWAPNGVVKVAIESLMSDETSHKVRVPAAIPSWLKSARARIAQKTLGSGGSLLMLDDDAPHSGFVPHPAPSPKPAAKVFRTKVQSLSHTWSVLVTRRSVSWLTMKGELLTVPLAVPPVPMRNKSASHLYNALFVQGLAGQLHDVIDKMLTSTDLPIKMRFWDSAQENKKLAAYEYTTIAPEILYVVIWCTMHINHALTTSSQSDGEYCNGCLVLGGPLAFSLLFP